MGKPNKQKTSSNKFKSLSTVLHVAFQDVNSGINKLVVGVTRTSTKTQNGGYGSMHSTYHTDSRAFDLDMNFNDKSDALDARIHAALGFLGKVAKSNHITVVTDDPIMLSVFADKTPIPAERMGEWKKLLEGIKHLDVISPDTTNAYERERLVDIDIEDMMAISDRNIRLRVNAIRKQHTASGNAVNHASCDR